jgi:hypothetical protein
VLISSVPSFSEVSDSDPTIEKLCGTPASGFPEEFARVAIAYGCRKPAPGQPEPVVKLILNVTDGPTDCGRSTNIIGCEPDLELLELNGKDYSFEDPGNDTRIGSGTGRVSLLQVMLHEVGHWIGLGHVTTDGSIMSAVIETSRCINDGDISELLKAISTPGRSSKLYSTPQALLAHP